MANLTEEQKRAIIKLFSDQISAEVFESDVLSPFTFQKITLDLGSARSIDNPLNIPFAFKAIALKNATGGTAQIFARFNSQDSGISWLPLDNNDSVNADRMFSGVDLYWVAQAGKTMDVLLFTRAQFSSGSLINSGTIAISPASTISTTRPNFAAATATSIIAASATRQRVTIENRSAQSIFLGESSAVTNAGATCGYELPVGGTIEYNNRAQIFAYAAATVAAGDLIVVEET